MWRSWELGLRRTANNGVARILQNEAWVKVYRLKMQGVGCNMEKFRLEDLEFWFEGLRLHPKS